MTDAMSDPIVIALSGIAVGMCLLAALLTPQSYAGSRMKTPLFCFFAALTLTEATVLMVSIAPKIGEYFALVTTPILMSILPALYFYVKRATEQSDEEADLNKFIHLVPILIGIALAVVSPFISRDANGNLEAVFDLNEPTLAGAASLIIVALGIAWVSQLIGYSFGIMRRIRKHRAILKDTFSDVSKQELKWITVLMMLIVVYVSYKLIALTFVALPVMLAERLDGILTIALIAYIAVFALHQRSTHEGDPNVQELPVDGKPKYLKSALTEDRKDRISQKLNTAMQSEHLFLDAGLSLPKLARAISEPAEYVTQTLNETIGETFFDYVNRWRIEEACERLLNSDESITMIAIDVGYNSRSAFYRSFKIITKQTPSEFRRDAKLNTVSGTLRANSEKG